MAVQERQILLSTERAWKKERVAWSQKWLPYHLPEGYLGVTGVRGQRQNESNQTPGNSPRRWRQARAYIDITHALNSNIQLYLSLAQQFLFDTFLCLKLNPYRTHFFLSFLAVERLNVQIFLFFYLQILLFTSKSDIYVLRIVHFNFSRNRWVLVCFWFMSPSMMKSLVCLDFVFPKIQNLLFYFCVLRRCGWNLKIVGRATKSDHRRIYSLCW